MAAAAATARRAATGLVPLLRSSSSRARPHHGEYLTLAPLLRPCRLPPHPARPFFCSAALSSSPAASNSAAAPERAPDLHLYNTRSRRREPFRPRAPGEEVGMYVCGVTPYDDSHIGHARAFDVLFRLGCTISFSECGGIEIEENWDKVKTVFLPTEKPMTLDACAPLIATLPLEVRTKIGDFIRGAFSVFQGKLMVDTPSILFVK